eukprot:gene21691-28714_t
MRPTSRTSPTTARARACLRLTYVNRMMPTSRTSPTTARARACLRLTYVNRMRPTSRTSPTTAGARACFTYVIQFAANAIPQELVLDGLYLSI